MIVLDQYRMQEIAYGHAGFLGGSVYANVPLAWLEHHLLHQLMARYSAARPLDIRYEANGTWLDGTAAAKPGTAATNNRVRIQYEGGLTITANGASNALAAGPWLLPQFGWVAEGAGISAGTVLRGDAVVDFADTQDTLFANARHAADWNLSNFRRVHPSVASFLQTTSRTFRVTYQWDVADRLSKDYRTFVHFTQSGTIRWQQDHTLAPPTSQWQPGQTVPDGPFTVTVPTNIADGDYDWLIGLFDLSTGARVRLLGVDDGSSRIRLGVLHVQDAGALITFDPETGAGVDPSPWYHQHLNETGAVIDFGAVRTDGSIWLRREANQWVLKTWPRDRNFTLELSARRFEPPVRVRCVGGAAAEVAPVVLGDRWRLPLNGAREYRWTNDGARASCFIPAGAVWKYFDTGANLGTAWRAPSFDDSTWPSGPAQLGFGDDDEATLVANNRQITTYFRGTFVVPDAALVRSLDARLLRDDGAVVYLNGVEVWRDNLPAGTITPATLAISNIIDAAETTWLSQSLSPAALVTGTNVVAVEIHQSGTNSSDISFDFELTGVTAVPARLTLGRESADPALSLAWPMQAGWFGLYSTSNLAPPIVWSPATNLATASNGQWKVTVPVAREGNQFFRLQAL